MLAIIIPAYNEASTLATVIDRVLALRFAAQVIVVSDGSTDGTSAIIERYSTHGRVKGIICAINRGKGAAIHEGLRFVDQPYTIIQDADLEYKPSEIEVLLNEIRQRSRTVLYGSRNLAHPQMRRHQLDYFRFWFGGKLVTLFANLLFGTHLTDEPTCYKLFPTDLLHRMNLRCRGFDFCPEVTAKSLRLGYRIKEMPIDYKPRTIAEGKKIRARDGMIALWVLLKYRVMPLRWMLKTERDGH